MRRLVVVIVTAAGVVWIVVGRIGVRQQIMNLGVLILLSTIISHLGSKRGNRCFCCFRALLLFSWVWVRR